MKVTGPMRRAAAKRAWRRLNPPLTVMETRALLYCAQVVADDPGLVGMSRAEAMAADRAADKLQKALAELDAELRR